MIFQKHGHNGLYKPAFMEFDTSCPHSHLLHRKECHFLTFCDPESKMKVFYFLLLYFVTNACVREQLDTHSLNLTLVHCGKVRETKKDD